MFKWFKTLWMGGKVFLIAIYTFIALISLGGCFLLLPTPKADMYKNIPQPWEADSVCDYKVCFVTTAYYKTMDDFWDAVIHTMNWLEDNGYRIIGMYPKYGKDMTQKEVLKFMYFQYVEIKKEEK